MKSAAAFHRSARSPLVSVALPVYNAESTVAYTLDALKNQTYSNLEFVVVNDGSTDKSIEIIKEKSYGDPRFTIIDRENRGLVDSLNEAIAVSRGEYILREDADDYSVHDRIAQQVAYMESHKDIVVAGSQSRNFGTSDAWTSFPQSPEDCKARLLFSPPLSHPAVIIRKSFLDEHSLAYSNDFRHCEDYALWVDISLLGGKLANLDSTLHFYRVHPDQVSVVHSSTTLANHYRLVERQLERLGYQVSGDMLKYLVMADKSLYEYFTMEDFKRLLAIYHDLLVHNSRKNVYEQKLLEALILNKAVSLIRNKLGLTGLLELFRSDLKVDFHDCLIASRKALLRSCKTLVKSVRQ